MEMAYAPEIRIIGTKLSLINKSELLTLIVFRIQAERRLVVGSGNIHSFNLAFRNKRLRRFLNNADVVRLDGAGLRLGARILGVETPPRITWADLGWDIAQLCQSNVFSIYLLGNKVGSAEKAAETLLATHPKLNIAGCMNGYFQKEFNHPENISVIESINRSQADILLVGMGMPEQEYWLEENMKRLDARVIMTAGAAFEWIAGEKKRAPEWMLNAGFEWLWRLRLEPRRLFVRYVIGNPLFLFRVLLQKLFANRCLPR
jgi:N-acetylglucosaminyldiphosphoundecaprenol N-acetyl-beta-D-mannosaminyltransferase